MQRLVNKRGPHHDDHDGARVYLYSADRIVAHAYFFSKYFRYILAR